MTELYLAEAPSFTVRCTRLHLTDRPNGSRSRSLCGLKVISVDTRLDPDDLIGPAGLCLTCKAAWLKIDDRQYCVDCGQEITLQRWKECDNDPICKPCEDAYNRDRDDALINNEVIRLDAIAEGR